MKLDRKYLEACVIDDSPAFDLDEIDELLQNQEDAEIWRNFEEFWDAIKNDLIVERLKKRIEDCNKSHDCSSDNQNYYEDLKYELQKILEGEKDG